MQYFNIQVASQLSGVASATIRAWEKRYNAVIPERAENKHRLYSETDIEKLAILFRLTEFGQSIGKIAHLELSELKNVYSTLLHRPYDEKELITPHHDKIDCSKILGNLILAISSYKIDIISHEIDKAKNLLSTKDFCFELIDPLLKLVENKLESHELSVIQAQTLRSIVSFHIGQLINEHYQKPIEKDGVVLIVGENKNEDEILCFSLLCIHYGLKFIYLSENTPAEALSEAAHSLQPKAILLNFKKNIELNALQDFLNNLSMNLSGKTQILVGGSLHQEQSVELEKKKILYFPTLQTLEHFLEKF